MTEGTLAPLRRRAVTAAGTGLLLVFVLAYGNQGLEKWRATTFARATGDYQQPLDALNSVTWRLMSQQGGSRAMESWLSQIVRDLVLLVATAFLIHLSTRGVASRRGRWSVFVGSWGATIIAAAIAGAAGSPLAVLGKGLSLTINPTSVVQVYSMISEGLMLGLLIGWVVGLAGVFAYRAEQAEEASAEASSAKERAAERERPEGAPWASGSQSTMASTGSWATSPGADTGRDPLRDPLRDSGPVRIGSDALRDPAVRPPGSTDAMRLPPLPDARTMGLGRRDRDAPTTPDRRRAQPREF